jgi:copper chaperone
MSTLVVEVSGMTCDHCVGSISGAVGALDGVESVEIDLDPTGHSTVSITHSRSDLLADVAQAVSGEGYTLEAVTENS